MLSRFLFLLSFIVASIVMRLVLMLLLLLLVLLLLACGLKNEQGAEKEAVKIPCGEVCHFRSDWRAYRSPRLACSPPPFLCCSCSSEPLPFDHIITQRRGVSL